MVAQLNPELWRNLSPSPTQPSTAFGCALAEFRTERRVSQAKLAKRAGYDHSYISRLESGSRTPTREAVVALAQALELEVHHKDELLISAGFLPQQAHTLMKAEPQLVEIFIILTDEEVLDPVKEQVRQQLSAICNLVRSLS